MKKLLNIYWSIILITILVSCGDDDEVVTLTPPIACFEVSTNRCEVDDCTIIFSAECSENVTNYKWDFDNDGIIDIEGRDRKEVRFTYTSVGNKTVRLEVGNSGGENEVLKTIEVGSKTYNLEIIDWDNTKKTIVEEMYPIPLKVKIGSNNPNEDIRNIEVQFRVISGNGQLVNNGFAISNELGIVSTNWILGKEVFEENEVELSFVNGQQTNESVSFNLTPIYFKDQRDSKVYKTTKINNQIWMSENLNYANIGICYDDRISNCLTYGRLYSWEEVNQLNITDAIPNNNRGICPIGWHIPQIENFTEVLSTFEATKLISCSNLWDSENSIKHNVDFSNESGLSLKPSGGYLEVLSTRAYLGINFNTYVWSSNKNNDRTHGIGFALLLSEEEGIRVGTAPLTITKMSCRCIKD